jgi:copper resistance protein B
LAPYWFQVEPTFYFSNDNRFAGRFYGSYDLLITNRLIAQPEIEMNFYSKSEPAREIGSGLADLDTGLRIRYEFSRKFAPYIGLAYTQGFGETATLIRMQHGIVHDLRFIFGVRIWY